MFHLRAHQGTVNTVNCTGNMLNLAALAGYLPGCANQGFCFRIESEYFVSIRIDSNHFEPNQPKFAFASQLLQQVGMKPTNMLQPLKIKYVSTTYYPVNSIANLSRFEISNLSIANLVNSNTNPIRFGTEQFAQPYILAWIIFSEIL